MRSVILVHPRFEASWPFAADHFYRLWAAQGPLEFLRLLPEDDRPVSAIIKEPSTVDRLVVLGARFTTACAEIFEALKEAAFDHRPAEDEPWIQRLLGRGVLLYFHPSEGFWGQSVAEFGLALTLCGLRRIPQTYRAMLTDHHIWDYNPPGGVGRPGQRGHQYGDDSRFTNGTISGKRVRIAGTGNIGSRYASVVRSLGAEVAAWDPFACEPAFHRSGARKVWRLEDLMADAEIFAPMMPLTDGTRGIITAEHITALPRGCLVVLVTRAGLCDMPTIRRRVLNDEIALAADVFDVEPLPLDDPLLGRHNVVHTPHNAGRTRDANLRWTEVLADQFRRPHRQDGS